MNLDFGLMLLMSKLLDVLFDSNKIIAFLRSSFSVFGKKKHIIIFSTQ